MSKYVHWWRPNVCRWLQVYPELCKNSKYLSPMEIKIIEAIDRTIIQASKWKDGQEILELIQEVYFSKSLTMSGAAADHHLSWNTASRRVNRFINAVATEVGLLAVTGGG